MNIEDTLQERGGTHGKFEQNSIISQSLQRIIFQSRNGGLFDDVQREALQMICHKICRICAGDPDFDDHWRDIAGYSQLVVDYIHREEPTDSTSDDMLSEWT
jgi:hypothetical protein